MNKEYNDVLKFHKAFGHPYAKTPTVLAMDRAKKRASWMFEEIAEFLVATKESDIVEQADAMIDLIYFALGTLVEMGIEPEEIFNVVQQANMGKLWSDGKPHYKESGKVQKPDNWVDPHPLMADIIKKMSVKSN